MWQLTSLLTELYYQTPKVTKDQGGEGLQYPRTAPWENEKTLFQHQLDAIEKMKTGHQHIIHITLGMGKTLIVMEHIRWCIEQRAIVRQPTPYRTGKTLV